MLQQGHFFQLKPSFFGICKCNYFLVPHSWTSVLSPGTGMITHSYLNKIWPSFTFEQQYPMTASSNALQLEKKNLY